MCYDIILYRIILSKNAAQEFSDYLLVIIFLTRDFFHMMFELLLRFLIKEQQMHTSPFTKV